MISEVYLGEGTSILMASRAWQIPIPINTHQLWMMIILIIFHPLPLVNGIKQNYSNSPLFDLFWWPLMSIRETLPCHLSLYPPSVRPRDVARERTEASGCPGPNAQKSHETKHGVVIAIMSDLATPSRMSKPFCSSVFPVHVLCFWSFC